MGWMLRDVTCKPAKGGRTIDTTMRRHQQNGKENNGSSYTPAIDAGCLPIQPASDVPRVSQVKPDDLSLLVETDFPDALVGELEKVGYIVKKQEAASSPAGVLTAGWNRYDLIATEGSHVLHEY